MRLAFDHDNQKAGILPMCPTKKISPKLPGGGDIFICNCFGSPKKRFCIYCSGLIEEMNKLFLWKYCPDCCYREMVPQVPVPSRKCVYCGEGNCKLGDD